MNAIYPLFSYPVMLSREKYLFTAEQEQYLAGLPMTENLGNLMSENDRVLDSGELADLRAFIDRQLAFYQQKILRLKPGNEIFITQSWVNEAKNNAFHPRHKHPNSLLSGVLFINGEEGDGLPPIRFHRGNDLLPLALDFEEYNDFNNGIHWFAPEKGLLILFPSALEHDVERNKTDRERISLSFNTFVRGPLGNKGQLTLTVAG